jgi:hypothetical protein
MQLLAKAGRKAWPDMKRSNTQPTGARAPVATLTKEPTTIKSEEEPALLDRLTRLAAAVVKRSNLCRNFLVIL